MGEYTASAGRPGPDGSARTASLPRAGRIPRSGGEAPGPRRPAGAPEATGGRVEGAPRAG
jgi:hypothetical protein